MGQVRKIGDEYYIEFYARGLLYQQKGGRDKNKAQELLHEIEEKIEQGEMGIIVRDVDMDIFVATFLDFVEAEHTKQTFDRFRTVLGSFVEFFFEKYGRNVKLSAVTPAVVERYRVKLVEEKVSAQELNFTLLLLRDVFEFAIKLGYLNDNPTTHVKFAAYAQSFGKNGDKDLTDCVEKAQAGLQGLLAQSGGELKSPELRDKINTLFADIAPGPDKVNALKAQLAARLIDKGVKLSKLYRYLGLEDIFEAFGYYRF